MTASRARDRAQAVSRRAKTSQAARVAKSLDAGFQGRWLVMHNGELQVELNDGKPYYKPKWPIRRTVTNVWIWTIILVLIADAALLAWAVWDLVTG